VLGVATQCASPRPPQKTLEGLAALLGSAAGVSVPPQAIAWEPSRGAVADALFGRSVLFLGASKPGEPRDVFRAFVRVSLDGKPIAVQRVRNLTDTPVGDDTGLEVAEEHAVFATLAFGRIQGITVLELSGVRGDDKPPSLLDRLLLAITAFQQTGSPWGIGRSDIVLDVPARRASMKLGRDRLAIDFGEAGRELSYELRTRRLRTSEGGQPYAARAIPLAYASKSLVVWGVDTLRAEIGALPIAWIENKVFGARDTVKRTTYAIFSSAKDTRLRHGGNAQAALPLSASKLGDDAATWPPPPIPSLWTETRPGEGQWQPVTYPFLEPLPGVTGRAPAYFQETFIRPDPKRPYSVLHLIAMDMRQLELGMQAGFEDPKPLTGPPGEGRLPQEPAILSRVVAAFNGAFKTTHGKYGMMVDRRVLVPPVAGAATVIVTEDHDVGLGSWPQSTDIPEEFVSFRQNLDPLVEDGAANPTGRFVWGWQLEGTSVMTQRTALCVTPEGNLYYAFGTEIDGPTLGQALRQAGCSYGIHLDMNPLHCGFVYSDIVNVKKGEYTFKVAQSDMNMNPDRYVRWSPKDFFYVMVRDAVPRDPSGVRWQADGGAQPPPAWLPGLFSGKATVGELEVDLFSFEKGRVDWKVRAGTLEPTTIGSAPHELQLAGSDAHRVLAAVGLGHTTGATRYGIAFQGKASLELRTAYATLVVGGGLPRLIPPGARPDLLPGEDAVQLPLLVDDGRLTEHASDHGPLRARAAMCVTPTGRVVVARAKHDSSDPLAALLVRIGCRWVVELDRGSQHPAFLHRAGTPMPPTGGYETSVLYALGRVMQPHAFRWKAQGAVASTRPTGFDVPAPKPRSESATADTSDAASAR